MENKKISMADIAKMSGVSAATVSRILNKNGRYSEETEQRVLDIIEKSGYRINLSAKALRTNKSQSIGIIVPDITNEFFAKIIRSIENNLRGMDYTVLVCDTNEDVDNETRQIKNLISKDVDGIIFISGKTDVKSIYNDYKIPVVYIDRRPQNAGKLVISDNYKGGYIATETLIKKGCKKIVVLKDYRNHSPIRNRFEGYKNAMFENKMPLSDDLIYDIQVDYNEAREKVNYIIKRGIKFDGIFAMTDVMAVGALHALNDNKISVPKDVKVIGFDDVTLASICNPPLSTIHQNSEEFGKRATEELLKLIDGEKGMNSVITIDVNLIERKTT